MVEAIPTPTRGRLRSLDALRLLAALGVVVFHYTNRQNAAWGGPIAETFPELATVTVFGAFGVQLFFMISGFVVLMSAWGRTVPEFVASRVSRLYPAYWVGVLATGLYLYLDRAAPGVANWDKIGIVGWLTNFTMVQPAVGVPNVDGVYWTLWAELKFYLLLGIFIAIGITRNRILLVCAAWPVAAMLAAISKERLLTEILQPDNAPFFAMGMILFLIWREGPSFITVILLLANLSFALRLGFTSLWWTTNGGPSHPWKVVALFIIFVLLILLATHGPLARLDWKWLSAAGALTYPLYVLHAELGWGLIGAIQAYLPPYVTLAIVIGVMLVAAWLVNRFVERPLGPIIRRAVLRSITVMPGTRAPEVKE